MTEQQHGLRDCGKCIEGEPCMDECGTLNANGRARREGRLPPCPFPGCERPRYAAPRDGTLYGTCDKHFAYGLYPEGHPRYIGGPDPEGRLSSSPVERVVQAALVQTNRERIEGQSPCHCTCLACDELEDAVDEYLQDTR